MNPQESNKLQKSLLTLLKKYISKRESVVVGVSGGSDSMFLLHLLKKLPCKLIIAHVNHQLRGKESDLDEEFVKKSSKGYIFASTKINIQELSEKHKRGIEELGRQVRYDFFTKLAKKYKSKYIVTAHQADENVETVLFNFARGASVQGLCGVQESEVFNKKIILLRPLVYTSKQQILEFLKLNKIQFRIDKSNEDTKYKRNFIRKEIIPKLKEINPQLVETVSKNIENLEEINLFLKQLASEWLSENTLNQSFSKINAKNFRDQSRALQKIIILELYKKIVGNTTNIQRANIDEILKIINSNIGNKKKKLGKILISVKNQIIEVESSLLS